MSLYDGRISEEYDKHGSIGGGCKDNVLALRRPHRHSEDDSDVEREEADRQQGRQDDITPDQRHDDHGRYQRQATKDAKDKAGDQRFSDGLLSRFDLRGVLGTMVVAEQRRDGRRKVCFRSVDHRRGNRLAQIVLSISLLDVLDRCQVSGQSDQI